MKLVIKELTRKNETVVQTWEKEFKSTEECLKYIKRIDKQVLKGTVKFEYTIKE